MCASISDFASVISAVATVGLVVYSIRQWRIMSAGVKESAKSRYAQLILSVADIMQKLEPDLRNIHNLMATQWSNWEPDKRLSADRVVGELQRVAFLCEKDLLDSKYILDGFGREFAESWNILYIYIGECRIRPNNRQFAEDFECVAKKCAKHCNIQLHS